MCVPVYVRTFVNVHMFVCAQVHANIYSLSYVCCVQACQYICMFLYQNQNYVKLESVRTLLRITRPAPRKSYLVIIFGVGSNIAQNHSSRPYEVKSGKYLPQFT